MGQWRKRGDSAVPNSNGAEWSSETPMTRKLSIRDHLFSKDRDDESQKAKWSQNGHRGSMGNGTSVQESETREVSGQDGFTHRRSLHYFLKPIESSLPSGWKRFPVMRAEFGPKTLWLVLEIVLTRWWSSPLANPSRAWKAGSPTAQDRGHKVGAT